MLTYALKNGSAMVVTMNEEQRAAVEHLEGPMLVLAGAGSGKTRVVTERIIRLLELGVPAGKILAVTFTNKAVGEMRSRVEEHFLRHEVLICTFHSLGARLLRESIGVLGWQHNFAIYDPDDCEKLIKGVMADLQLADKNLEVKSFAYAISRAKNALQGPDAVEGLDLVHPYDELLPRVYALYQEKLKQCQAVDFDDLLYLPVRLLREHSAVLERYQQRWDFLLVDEYQDTNAAQYRLLRLLAGERCNVFVVGDPDQSIYSWRGADVGNIMHFEQDFSGARVLRLEQNYRSTSTILEASNALIARNSQRYEKNLWSDRGAGELIKLYSADSEREEAAFVCSRIRHHQREGRSLNEMVLFYRTNQQSRHFEELLLSYKIPYVVIGAVAFYQRREIKDILAYLRMVVSDADFVSFARTINLPKRGIGDGALEKLWHGASVTGEPIYRYCCGLVEGRGGAAEDFKPNKRQRDGLAAYVQLIDGLRRRSAGGASLRELLMQLLQETSYLEQLKQDPLTAEERIGNVDSLLAKAVEWQEERGAESTLAAFLEELSLKTSEEAVGPSEERVSLMTLHNSKGLEFPIVFLCGLEEDMLPHANSRGSEAAVEEERRLCYVGMTRAKELLYLCHARQRTVWGMTRAQRPSRFIGEVPERYIEKVRRFHERPAVVEESAAALGGSPGGGPSVNVDLKVGDSVVHADFGVGVIRAVVAEGGSLGTLYRVFFAKERAEKTLVAKFAHLKKIG